MVLELQLMFPFTGNAKVWPPSQIHKTASKGEGGASQR